jgi:hypothetical protein
MARPTSAPRISTLSPAVVAAEVDRRLLEHLGQLAFVGGFGITVRVDVRGSSDLAVTAQALCEYAQKGLPVWDWETDEEAADACQSLVSRFWSPPAEAGSGTFGLGPLGDGYEEADMSDPIELVLVAAWARVELSRDEPVTARQLAALAGLDPQAVRLLAREGEIKLHGKPAVAAPSEARRWLAARGVKGL